MLKKHFTFFLLIYLLACSCLAASSDFRSNKVLVSITPHKYFVERIAGDLLQVKVLIPAGSSSHTYEPTPRQVVSASEADLWFRIGEPMEQRALAALQSHNSRLKPIDLRKEIDLITDHHKGCAWGNHYYSCGEDLHFWLSPVQAKIQAKTIADELIKHYPEQTKIFLSNLELFLTDLDQLHAELTELLKPVAQRTFIVSHPGYTYFSRDYDLSQVSIEFEGKDPTPRQLTSILETIRKNKIKKIFIQPQYQNKGAILVAKEVGAKLVTIDPYSENYLETLRTLGKEIAGK